MSWFRLTDPERFWAVIVEAQAMGRPVVATDHGGARETIVPGVTGRLCRRGTGGLLRRSRTLALDPETRYLGRQARAQVAAGYTREIMAPARRGLQELLFPEPRRLSLTVPDAGVARDWPDDRNDRCAGGAVLTRHGRLAICRACVASTGSL
jgi:hypothetical protein